MKTLTEIFVILINQPAGCALMIALMLGTVGNSVAMYKNYSGIKQIKYTLFGNSHERDVNGHGIYQKVDEIDNKLENLTDGDGE